MSEQDPPERRAWVVERRWWPLTDCIHTKDVENC